MEEGRDGGASVSDGARARPDEVVIRIPNLFAWLREQLPDEFVDHMRAARREQLLAMRSLIDRAIERTEEPGRKSRRVEIEVD